MPTYEELVKAGATPGPAAAQTSAVPGQGLSYDQLVAMGATEAPAAPAQEPMGAGESIVRGAFQGATLGFGDELTGAVRSLFGPNTYQQERDAAREANASASESHPWLYGGGELAGGIGTVFIPGLNVAKGASLVKAGLTAAKAGAISGLGGSEADLTTSDFAGSIRDTVKGAITGGVTGAALHGIGQKLGGKAVERFEGETIKDAMSRARPKDYVQTQKLFESEEGAARKILHSEDFKPVQKALRSGDTEKGREALTGYLDKVGANREADWHALDKALGDKAGISSGKVLDRFENEIQKAGYQHGQSDIVKVLTGVKERLKQTWSTADRDSTVAALEKAGAGEVAAAVRGLEKKALTGADVWETAEKIASVDGVIPEPIRKAISSVPFEYVPTSKVPGSELRKALTKAQDEAVASLGTIAETEHARLKAAPEKVFNSAMDVFLDQAKAHSPEAGSLAAKILDRNKKLTLALAFQEGLEQRAKKEMVGSKGLTAGIQGTAGTLLKGMGVGHLLSGNFGAAAAEIAAPYAMKGASMAARRANDTLARIMYAAEQGNPWAIKQMTALRNTPQGLSRIQALRGANQKPEDNGPTSETMDQL